MKKIIITLLVVILVPVTSSASYLADDFDDGVIDSSLWDTYLPTWQGTDGGAGIVQWCFFRQRRTNRAPGRSDLAFTWKVHASANTLL